MIAPEQLRRAAELAAGRRAFATATVLRARRPASVRPGDSALVLGDGTVEGFVGGQCALASVRLHALRALETGEPLLLRIVTGSERACEEAEETAAPPGTPGALPGLAEGTVAVERNPCLSGGSLELFIEPRLPPPLIAVAGSSPVARALLDVARAAGLDGAGLAPGQELPGDACALVVATHGTGEEPLLEAALRAGFAYVALVASHRRGEAVRAALAVPDELRARLRTPAGLRIGARTPGEVAVSILAEIIAALRAGPAGPRAVQDEPGQPAAHEHRCCHPGSHESHASCPA